jgi:hypothetical protein
MFMSSFCVCHINGESIQGKPEGDFKNTNLNFTEVHEKNAFCVLFSRAG